MNRRKPHSFLYRVSSYPLFVLARISAFVLVCAMVLLPILPVYAADDAASQTATEAQPAPAPETEPSPPPAPENEPEESPPETETAASSEMESQESTGDLNVGAEEEPIAESETEAKTTQQTDVQSDTVSEQGSANEESPEVVSEATEIMEESDEQNVTGEAGGGTSSQSGTSATKTPSANESLATTTSETSGDTTTTSTEGDTASSTTVPAVDGEVAMTATTTVSTSTSETETSTSTEGTTPETPESQNVDQNTTPTTTTTESETVTETTDEETTDSSDQTATSSIDNGPVIVTDINDGNRFQFSKDQCVMTGDGMYYCTDQASETAATPKEGVFTDFDTDGDREIYITRDGNQEQITHNIVDDNAPFYDEVSHSVVWHRQVEGRYQIMEYNLETREERQLTTERYNNMEPTRYGDTIVWQGWVGSDWEIMLEEDGTFMMLTDNTTNDISPTINGDHIVWQSFEDNAWKVKVYDRISGQIDTIEDADGGSIENPRFVLVYDTKFSNGDIETRGYDVKSGEVVPLSSAPAPLPEEIPDPEPTDEDRALVQQVVSVKTKPTNEEGDGDGVTPAIDTTDDTATGTADIVIPPLGTASSTDTGLETATGTVDIIIPVPDEVDALTTEDTPTSTPDHIDDLIVTPFTEPIATSTDSQESIATST